METATTKADEGKYVLNRKVLQLGPSLAVTFPRWLGEAKGLCKGESVRLKFNGFPGLVIEKVTDKQGSNPSKPRGRETADENAKECARTLQSLLSSTVKAEIICQYRQNPRLVDSPVGLAQKIGAPVASIKTGLKGLELLGILVRTQVGTSEMFALNEARDKEIQTMLAEYLATSKADQSRTHLSDEKVQ